MAQYRVWSISWDGKEYPTQQHAYSTRQQAEEAMARQVRYQDEFVAHSQRPDLRINYIIKEEAR